MQSTVDNSISTSILSHSKVTHDLAYWQRKLNHFESLYGHKKEDGIKVCKMMLDLYLDRYSEEKKLYSHWDIK